MRTVLKIECIGASMGPRSFNRGNVPDTKPLDRHSVASMGPRSFNRGNHRAKDGRTWQRYRFNGAAVFQPRKCGRVKFMMPDGIAASMGPRSFNRGNLGKMPQTCASRRSFNGAAVFQPRK